MPHFLPILHIRVAKHSRIAAFHFTTVQLGGDTINDFIRIFVTFYKLVSY